MTWVPARTVWVTNEANVAATFSYEVVRIDDPFDFTKRAAIARFLAPRTGNTIVSYTTDLRLFVEWRPNNDLRLLKVRRALDTRGTMEAEGRCDPPSPDDCPRLAVCGPMGPTRLLRGWPSGPCPSRPWMSAVRDDPSPGDRRWAFGRVLPHLPTQRWRVFAKNGLT